jgi:hypothetical protein
VYEQIIVGVVLNLSEWSLVLRCKKIIIYSGRLVSISHRPRGSHSQETTSSESYYHHRAVDWPGRAAIHGRRVGDQTSRQNQQRKRGA